MGDSVEKNTDNYNKKRLVKAMIDKYVIQMLNLAEENSSLDHFELSITNHQGSLQMDCKLRDRHKVY